MTEKAIKYLSDILQAIELIEDFTIRVQIKNNVRNTLFALGNPTYHNFLYICTTNC